MTAKRKSCHKLSTLSILITICHTLLLTSALRIWSPIKYYLLADIFLYFHHLPPLQQVGMMRRIYPLVTLGSEILKAYLAKWWCHYWHQKSMINEIQQLGLDLRMGNLNRELKVQNLKKSSVQSVTCPLWTTIYEGKYFTKDNWNKNWIIFLTIISIK